MSVFERIKEMLGLAGDDYYEEYEEDYYEEDEEDDDEEEAYRSRSVYRSPHSQPALSVRRVERDSDSERRPGGPAQVQMHIVEPRTFAEAQAIADRFKRGVPVIMNLATTDAELSKRLLDFASGLSYGLDGGLQKVSERVFMLTPANVDVSAEQRRQLKDKGLFSVEL